MKCPRCQHENEAGAKFCEECATPQVTVLFADLTAVVDAGGVSKAALRLRMTQPALGRQIRDLEHELVLVLRRLRRPPRGGAMLSTSAATTSPATMGREPDDGALDSRAAADTLAGYFLPGFLSGGPDRCRKPAVSVRRR